MLPFVKSFIVQSLPFGQKWYRAATLDKLERVSTGLDCCVYVKLEFLFYIKMTRQDVHHSTSWWGWEPVKICAFTLYVFDYHADPVIWICFFITNYCSKPMPSWCHNACSFLVGGEVNNLAVTEKERGWERQNCISPQMINGHIQQIVT